MPGVRTATFLLVLLSGLGLCSCDAPKVTRAIPDLLAAHSATSFAVDLEFASPLERTSAEQATRYALVKSSGERVTSARAVLIDSLFGETVRLVFPLGTLEDSTRYGMVVTGVHDAWGASLASGDSITTQFESGLWYSRPVRQLLEQKCTPCHNSHRAGGNYRTDSYEALFGYGSDGSSGSPRPNVIAGDARSLLLIRTAPHHSMFNVAHMNVAESQILLNWVVSFEARR